MENFSLVLFEHMQYRPLYIVVLPLAAVIGLVCSAVARNQTNLRPATDFGPGVDFLGRCLGDSAKSGILPDLVRAAVKSIH